MTKLQAVSNTGPLISAFQSNAINIVSDVLAKIHIPELCVQELRRHGWHKEVNCEIASGFFEIHVLTEWEESLACEIANQIAGISRVKEPTHHLGEATALALACRSGFEEYIVLIDEKAARQVAIARGQKLSGFAGILLQATKNKLITPDDVKNLLEECRRRGTRYSQHFIDDVYTTAQEVYR